ncbi:hypothetical protein V5799_026156 [Amblyomma americanum]|uniref:Major facilitator superfamily (MFS) profile domain-containing protein n=1 Tax=Amblyomma americanum TaxID=6943 RepID=A0AAQ4DJD8_AMBAM
MVPANVVVLNRYFDKYRASASGVSFAGAALSSALLPPFIGWLLDAYGLQGTMLIIGGLVLNVMAGAIVLHSTPTYPRAPQCTHWSSTSDSSDSVEQRGGLSGPASPGSKTLLTDLFSTDALLWESGIVVSALPHSGPKRPRPRPGVRPTAQVLGFLREPMFVVLMVTGMAYGYVFSTYLITIVDHAVGAAQASNEDGALLISAMAVGDFLSRLFAGYITDRRFITREQLLVVNFAIQGVCYVLLTRLASVAHMLVVALVFGLNNGGTITAMPVLLADYLGDHHLPLTYGLHRLTMGMATLFRPMLIGYFKDQHGSYNGLYYLVAGFCAFTVVLWSLIIAADSIKRLLFGRPNPEDAVAIPA